MSIARAANELMRVAAEAGVLGKFSVVIHFDDIRAQDKFEKAVLVELQSSSLRADEHFTTLKALRIFNIPFEFIAPKVYGGDD